MDLVAALGIVFIAGAGVSGLSYYLGWQNGREQERKESGHVPEL